MDEPLSGFPQHHGARSLRGRQLGSKAFSPSVPIYANDVIREARHVSQSFELNEAAIGLEEIAEIGPGSTCLEWQRTFGLFREAYQQSDVLPLLTFEAQRNTGEAREEEALRQCACRSVEGLESPEGHDELIARAEAFINELTASEGRSQPPSSGAVPPAGDGFQVLSCDARHLDLR